MQTRRDSCHCGVLELEVDCRKRPAGSATLRLFARLSQGRRGGERAAGRAARAAATSGTRTPRSTGPARCAGSAPTTSGAAIRVSTVATLPASRASTRSRPATSHSCTARRNRWSGETAANALAVARGAGHGVTRVARGCQRALHTRRFGPGAGLASTTQVLDRSVIALLLAWNLLCFQRDANDPRKPDRLPVTRALRRLAGAAARAVPRRQRRLRERRCGRRHARCAVAFG